MDDQMSSREEFLRAQYAEDERIALAAAARGGPVWPDAEGETRTPAVVHARRHDPARELAELAMKRWLLTEVAPKLDEMCQIIAGEWGDSDGFPDGDEIRKVLTLPYPGRPCPDCAVLVGHAHEDGCDIAACTLCGHQRITCAHVFGEGGWGQIWDGTMPGVADARRFSVDLNELGRMANAGLVEWDQTHQRWEPAS